MRVAFINPPRTVLNKDPIRAGTPLGLLSLAGMVRRYFPEVDIHFIDMVVKGKEKQEIKKGVFGFGLTSDELKNKLIKIGIKQGDLVAISNIFTSEWKNAALCTKIAKELGAITILGGHHATYMPGYMLEFTKADYIVLGEGELPFIELVDSILEQKTSLKELKKIKGIAFRSEDKIINTGRDRTVKNMDELEDPAFDLLDSGLYIPKLNHWGKISKESSAFIDYSISRGCPMGCRFCTSTDMWGRKIRIFSSERIKTQLRKIRELRFDNLAIEDDQIVLLPEKERKVLFRELRNLSFKWVIDAGLYYPSITEDFVRELADNGCYNVFIPIEHPILEIMHNEEKYRKIKAQEEVKNTLKILFKMLSGYKINFYIGIMVGFVQETKKTLEAVLEYAKFAKEQGASNVMFSFVKPFPGTKYDRREITIDIERSWTLFPEYWTFSTPVLKPKELTIRELTQRVDGISMEINGRKNSLIGLK
ncbi:MAG: radical SAM protein [Candidatus Micrarchaeia archaeon]